MARQILRQAVHHEVRAQLQRPHQQRRGERVVHNQGRSRRLRHCATRSICAHAQQRIRNRLHQQRARLGFRNRRFAPLPDRRNPRTAPALPAAPTPSSAGSRSRRTARSPRQSTSADRSAPSAAPRGSPPSRSCTPARRARLRAPRTVPPAPRWSDCRSAHSWARLLAAEHPVELLHALVEIAGRGVNRRGDRDVRARPFCGRPHGRPWLSCMLHFLFHRTPSLVSSRMMPSSSSSSRIRSGARNCAPSWPACAPRSALPPPHRKPTALLRARPQHIENRIEAVEECARRPHILGAKFARIHGDVGFAEIFEHRAQRFGRIQIVIQALAELLLRLPPSALPSSRCPRPEISP